MKIIRPVSADAEGGFTLIELLVVIAIIGLLAAVVLASLGGARQKGVDAAVQSSLNSARTQAELYASNNNNKYTGVCTASGGLGGSNTNGILYNAANETNNGSNIVTSLTSAGAYNYVTCHEAANGAGWAVEAPLSASASGSPVMWCVDSNGASRKETSNITASAYTCP